MAGAIPTIPLPSAETERLPVSPDRTPISPRQFGAGLAEGLQVAAAGLDKVQAEADALAAQDAETSFSREILQKVHGTVDEKGELKPGFANLKGHQALEASSSLTRDLTERRQQIASQLANDRQRRVFLGRTQGDLLGAQRAIEGHVSEQVSMLQREGLKTRLETATQNAAASVLTQGGAVDLIGADRQIQAMKPWLEVAAEQQGLKGEDADRFVRQGQGAVAVAVMERLLEDPVKGGQGHAKEAKAFLEANRGLFDVKTAMQFGQRLGAADLRDRSLVESDRIWADSEGDPGKAAAAVRSITDAGLRDAVQTRIGQRLEQDRAIRVASDAPREGRLEQAIYTGRGLDVGAQDFLALSDEGKARVLLKAKAAARGDSAEQRAIDQELYWTFRGLPMGGDPGKDQVSTDVAHDQRFASASPAMRSRIQFEQAKAKQEWAQTSGTGRDTFLRQAREIADQLGWQGSEAPGSPTNRAGFLRVMQVAYDGWLQKNPGAKVVPQEEARKMFMDALRFGDLSGESFNLSQNRYAWEAKKQGEIGKFTTKGFTEQPGLTAVERVLGPGAPRTVRLRGPNGEGWTAPASPDLDAWLKTHPGWRAE